MEKISAEVVRIHYGRVLNKKQLRKYTTNTEIYLLYVYNTAWTFRHSLLSI